MKSFLRSLSHYRSFMNQVGQLPVTGERQGDFPFISGRFMKNV